MRLVSKCSATLPSLAAPPPGAWQGWTEVQTTRDTPPRWQCHIPPSQEPRYRGGCNTALWGGGGTCDTPATHSTLRKELRRGPSYTLECDGGGVASAPLRRCEPLRSCLWRQCAQLQEIYCRSHSRETWKIKFSIEDEMFNRECFFSNLSRSLAAARDWSFQSTMKFSNQEKKIKQ